VKNKEFIIKIRKYPKDDPDVDIEVTVEWKDGKVFGWSCKYNKKEDAIKACKNTIALLEKHGSKALDKDGDISKEFVRENCFDTRDLSMINFIIDEQI
jgi:hypothetical protein